LLRGNKRKKTQITKVRKEKSDITTKSKHVKRKTMEHGEQLHANKFDNLGETHLVLLLFSGIGV
jgi:hypothetical protein